MVERVGSRNVPTAPRRGVQPADGVAVPVVQEQVLHGAGAVVEPFPLWRRDNKLAYWPPGAGGRARAGGPPERVGWTTIHDGAADLGEVSVHKDQILHGAGVLMQRVPAARRSYPPHQAPRTEKIRRDPRRDLGLVQPLAAEKNLNVRHARTGHFMALMKCHFVAGPRHAAAAGPPALHIAHRAAYARPRLPQVRSANPDSRW
jgi:hypothetical protein